MLFKSPNWLFVLVGVGAGGEEDRDRSSETYLGESTYISSLVFLSGKLVVWTRWFSNSLSRRRSPFASKSLNIWQELIHVSMLDHDSEGEGSKTLGLNNW